MLTLRFEQDISKPTPGNRAIIEMYALKLKIKTEMAVQRENETIDRVNEDLQRRGLVTSKSLIRETLRNVWRREVSRLVKLEDNITDSPRNGRQLTTKEKSFMEAFYRLKKD